MRCDATHHRSAMSGSGAALKYSAAKASFRTSYVNLHARRSTHLKRPSAKPNIRGSKGNTLGCSVVGFKSVAGSFGFENGFDGGGMRVLIASATSRNSALADSGEASVCAQKALMTSLRSEFRITARVAADDKLCGWCASRGTAGFAPSGFASGFGGGICSSGGAGRESCNEVTHEANE